MIKYAFYVRPDDIYNVLLILRDANAKWAGWSIHADFMEESADVIKSHGYTKNGMAVYIKFVGERNPKILMQHSSVDYLHSNAKMISNEGYNIIDNIYLIPEFSELTQDELEANDTNFFDI